MVDMVALWSFRAGSGPVTWPAQFALVLLGKQACVPTHAFPLALAALAFALSPDGGRLANILHTRTRLTTEGNNRRPTWTRDGTYVTFGAGADLYPRMVAGSPTSPTSPAGTRSTCDPFQLPPASGRSRAAAERSRSGPRIGSGPAFSAARPEILFEGAYDAGNDAQAYYDIVSDGSELVMISAGDAPAPTRIHVVLNWIEELKAEARGTR